jgi:hypothetical protein
VAILLKPTHNVAVLIPYEQLFIQAFKQNGNLIPEQYSDEPNPLFQLVIYADLTSQLSIPFSVPTQASLNLTMVKCVCT